MVRSYYLTLLFLCLSTFANAIVPTLEISIEPSTDGIERPLSVTITLTHSIQDKVDQKSFELDGKPLQVDIVKKVKIGSDELGTALSIYRFDIPAGAPGKHVLHPISVKIDGKVVHSDAVDYVIATPSIAPQADSDILFKLEASVEGPTTLYPGQRARVVYRIYYNRSIDITTSEFPMLYTPDFRRIGDKQVLEAQKEGLTVQELSQEIEALKPGTFTFGPSFIEGYAYQENVLGKKVYQGSKIRSETPSMKIEVLPFPIVNQPLSFSGAIGDLKITWELLTPAEMEIGDKIKLKMVVESEHNLDEMRVPNLSCQPGISGFFNIDSVEPGGSGKGFKSFIINLRPKTSLAAAIPPIEIASFDPEKQAYLKQNSKAMPIHVKAPKVVLPPNFETTTLDNAALAFLDKKFKAVSAGNLEVSDPIAITMDDIGIAWYKTALVLYLVPFGVAILILQWVLGRKRLNE